MANSYFQFKQFIINQDQCAMKVTTDGCLFGAWVAGRLRDKHLGDSLVLDIGTGTGLLSLMLAQQTNLLIDAVEIDTAAAMQASANIAATPWQEKIRVIEGDIKEIAEQLSPTYDTIISNPPFYENELQSPHVLKNKAHHDQGLVLDELLEIISRQLTKQGEFYLLLPYKRRQEAELLFEKNHLSLAHTCFVRQTTKHDYFRIMFCGKHSKSRETVSTSDEIAIRNDAGEYTAPFIDLLKDYYLHL